MPSNPDASACAEAMGAAGSSRYELGTVPHRRCHRRGEVIAHAGIYSDEAANTDAESLE